MGARCALLTISPKNVMERMMSRNPEEWVGKTELEINDACKLLIDQQQEYRRQAEKSIIPTIEVNTDGQNWEDYAKQILLFN
ncbi:hypothetical protein [Peribacillus deserti]|uniref:hypothetical protein n=1 Tax=Peribacillus deserti TaxID=673318 RepID=UPI00215287C5|nr:hypothetical protein [Peribacillus deserti]